MPDVVRPTTIMVPVYGDLPSLKDCLDSLIEHVDTGKHKVMLVNDCGPDADEIESYLKKTIEDIKGFSYFRNPENLGFVGACNRAVMKLDDTGNDILLLNSDTIVTEGFLEEMSAVLYAKQKNAVVSPRTNNATIATVPLSAARHKDVKAQKSYEIFQRIKPFMPRYSEVPVGHGFCMLIKRSVIDEYGLFDAAFGRGYGEEVDFCMRIKQEGYKCILSNRAYVFHLEAKSFTHATKAELLSQNSQIIKQRYPNYSETIQNYIEKALKKETEALNKAGIKPYELESDTLKRLVKRNQSIHRFARKIYKVGKKLMKFRR